MPHTRNLFAACAAAACVLAMTPSHGIAASPTDTYIVMMKTDVVRTQSVTSAGASVGARDVKELSHIGAFTANMDANAADKLRRRDDVASVSKDSTRTIQELSWGLDRIDQRTLPLNKSYRTSRTGAGAHIYVIDSGLRATHREFAGRVGKGWNAMDQNNDTNDCHGHGTHVSGTAAGATYGVATRATIHPVKAMNCKGEGPLSGVIRAADWVIANAERPAVVNMSIGGDKDDSEVAAVERMTKAGITVVVAASNYSKDACNYSPAAAPSAITVGATNNADKFDWYSNFGKCLDINAPGTDILSATIGSDTATKEDTGTSMASPHVAGAAALYVAENPKASVAQVTEALLKASSKGKLSSTQGSPNRLLFVDFSAPVDTSPEQPNPDKPGGEGRCGKDLKGTVAETKFAHSQTFTLQRRGHIQGCLNGPADTDFDLSLEKKSGNLWSTVAKVSTNSSIEEIEYDGDAGEYRFKVWSYKGTGTWNVSYNVK